MKKIIIFGLPVGGIFGLYQLRKRWPKSLIYIVAPKGALGFYFKGYDKYIDAQEKDEIVKAAKEAYEELGKGEVDAYIMSNRMLEYIVSVGKELFSFLHFENDYETYKRIVDKTMIEGVCAEIGIRIPKYYHLTLDVSQMVCRYPVVIKPIEKYSAQGAEKCKYISDVKSLESYLGKLNSLGISLSNMVCQEAIRGNNTWEYGYGGYFVDGKPKVDICFHEYCQHPQGLCYMTAEIADEELCSSIRAFVLPLLKHLHYTGFAEFDIKQDEVTKQMYLLDFNPRPWGSVDMLCKKLDNSSVYDDEVKDGKKLVLWKKPLLKYLAAPNPNNPSEAELREMLKGRKYAVQYSLWYANNYGPFRRLFYRNSRAIVGNYLRKLGVKK